MSKTLAALSGIGMIVVAMLIYGGYYLQIDEGNSNVVGVAYQSGDEQEINHNIECVSSSDCENGVDCINNKCIAKKDIKIKFPNR